MGQVHSDGFDCTEENLEESAKDANGELRECAPSADSGYVAPTTPQKSNDINNNLQASGQHKREGKRCFTSLFEFDGRFWRQFDQNKTAPQDQKKHSHDQQQQHARKLSNVSHRNIQLLAMKPRTDNDVYADNLRIRRRSSLINLILGAPSSGPRFSDDLCSINSRVSNFGIEFFPDGAAVSPNSLVPSPNTSSWNVLEDAGSGTGAGLQPPQQTQLHQTPTSSMLNQLAKWYHHDGFEMTDGSAGGDGRRACSVTDNQAGAGQQRYKLNDVQELRPDVCTNQMRRRSSSGSLVSFGARKFCDDAQRPSRATCNDSLSRHSPAKSGDAGDSASPTSYGADSSQQPSADRLDRNGPIEQLCKENNERSTSQRTTRHVHETSPEIVAPEFNAYRATQAADSNCTRQLAKLANTTSATFTSIDLMRSFDSAQNKPGAAMGSNLLHLAQGGANILRLPEANHLYRPGSELSLYSGGSYVSTCTSANGPKQQQQRQRSLLNQSLDGPNGRDKPNGQSSDTKASSSKPTFDSSMRETKLIILLQVCLPFILCGFGNMAAGVVLDRVVLWKAFRNVPTFVVLLPPFVGLKGNIEMTLASRLSTLSNLKLLDTPHQRRHAYASNLVLVLSQAIGLSSFAALISVLCEWLMSAGNGASQAGNLFTISSLVVLPSALVTAIVLVLISSCVVPIAVGAARFLQVNPDNLSTLVAALYGDVSCVFIYGVAAERMYLLREQSNFVWPILIVCLALTSFPLLCYFAYRFKETHSIALASMPPMLTGIMISMCSGAILSQVVNKFHLIALYQPVVNGFGANLIAVQASRVSTWLWCSELRRDSCASLAGSVGLTHRHHSINALASASSRAASLGSTGADFEAILQAKKFGSLASFEHQQHVNEKFSNSTSGQQGPKTSSINARDNLSAVGKLLAGRARQVLRSFCNKTPNAIAARLLLIMLVPAQTLYFFTIWVLSPSGHVTLTWSFYLVYVTLCLVQVFLLLAICEPLMTVLMKRHFDPDIFGISLLMALADLTGTLCLTCAFYVLHALRDANAHVA